MNNPKFNLFLRKHFYFSKSMVTFFGEFRDSHIVFLLTRSVPLFKSLSQPTNFIGGITLILLQHLNGVILLLNELLCLLALIHKSFEALFSFTLQVSHKSIQIY